MSVVHSLLTVPIIFNGEEIPPKGVIPQWDNPAMAIVAKIELLFRKHPFSKGVHFTVGGHTVDYTPPIGGICIVPKDFLAALQKKYPLTHFVAPTSTTAPNPAALSMDVAEFRLGDYTVHRIDGLTFAFNLPSEEAVIVPSPVKREAIRVIEQFVLKGQAQYRTTVNGQMKFMAK